MFKLSILSNLLTIFVIICKGDNMLGPGKWTIISIERCEEDDLYSTKIDVEARRLNRSHVGFSFNVYFDEQVNDFTSLRIDICKYVDGGCKAYQTLADESVIHFSEKYAKQNVKTAFKMAKLSGWPIYVGNYALDDYIFNVDELPKDSLYGDYVAKGYLINNAVDFACVKVATKFEKCEDED